MPHDIFTYQIAKCMLGNCDRRKIENNTYLVRLSDTCIAVQLHDTYVVTIYADGTYTLNSGGYLTKVTVDRLNKYGPVRVHRQYGKLYCVLFNKATGVFVDCEFTDDMIVDSSGDRIKNFTS